MAQHKIDALMLTQGTSLVYFTNIRWGGGERLTACVIPARETLLRLPRLRGRPRPRADRARPVRRAARRTCGRGTRTRARTRSSPAGSKDRGVARGTLGIEENDQVRVERQRRAGRAAAEADQRHADRRRLPHDQGAAEIELMRLASQVTLKAYEAAYRALQPGMTQDTVAD
jgi:Xaa-Pro dipeptidase